MWRRIVKSLAFLPAQLYLTLGFWEGKDNPHRQSSYVTAVHICSGAHRRVESYSLISRNSNAHLWSPLTPSQLTRLFPSTDVNNAMQSLSFDLLLSCPYFAAQEYSFIWCHEKQPHLDSAMRTMYSSGDFSFPHEQTEISWNKGSLSAP